MTPGASVTVGGSVTASGTSEATIGINGFDIDVQGAKQLRESLVGLDPRHPVRRGFTDIFISPPSFDALEERLRGRGTDDEKIIKKRLQNAEIEMESASEYVFQVVNDDLETAYQELKNVILTATGF